MYENYAKLRDNRGVSDYAVAKACGFNPATLSDWKRGQYTPKADKMQKIADYFGVPLSYFYASDDGDHYYLDKATRDAAEELRTNKELRLLFDAGRDASPEDLRTVHQMLLALKRKENHDA